MTDDIINKSNYVVAKYGKLKPGSRTATPCEMRATVAFGVLPLKYVSP